MSLEITACRSQERHNHQGDDDYSQNCVAKKDNKVDRSNNANSREARGAMIIMISKVRREKESGSYHRRDLAIAMSIHSTAANKQESANQQDRTGAV
jgi:hypothetical protein